MVFTLRKKIQGFSLIEICIVMIVVGLILSGAITQYGVYVHKQRIERTNQNLAVAQHSLQQFYERFGRFPCPAGTMSDPARPEYAREADCFSMNKADLAKLSVVKTGDGKKQEVAIGYIPVKSLGLLEKYSRDGWEKNIIYAVSVQTTEDKGGLRQGYLYDKGVIKLVDRFESPLLDPPALYVLYSGGQNKSANMTTNGGFLSCPVNSYEGENCDGDSTFIREAYSEADGQNYYDDYLIHDRDIILASDGVLSEQIQKLISCQNRMAFYDPDNINADDSGCVISTSTRGVCPAGHAVGGITSTGQVSCIPNMQSGLCRGGETLLGYDDTGNLICSDIVMKIQSCAQSGLIYAGEGTSGANAHGCVMPAVRR